MFSIIQKAINLLSVHERRQLKWLLLAAIIVAIIEVSGIASILPFMLVVMDPGAIDRNYFLSSFYEFTGIQDRNDFVILLGFLVLVVLAFGNAFTALANWLITRFSFLAGHSLAIRLLYGYMHQPYSVYMNRNPAELNKNIQTEVHRFVAGFLGPLIRFFSRSIVAIVIILLLLFVDVTLALILTSVLGVFYVIVYRLVKVRLGETGKAAVDLGRKKYVTSNVIFGALKEIKLANNEEHYMEEYTGFSRDLALKETNSEVIAILPRYIIELVAFGSVILVVLYYLGTESQIETIIPVISLYAFSGYRLMPALQMMYGSLTKIKYNVEVVEVLSNEINQLPSVDNATKPTAASEPLFKNKISLTDITYQYPNTSTDVLKGISLEINKGDFVSFVGETGSGKSTLVDIILGLLKPDSGEINIDGIILNDKNLPGWQKQIGYVPQAGYISNTTISRNIAFSVPADEIDMGMVRDAAIKANIHEFIVSSLENGYETLAGDRGVKLSGGQVQRLLIARALYNNPDVLVFDEATSALDTVTEKLVMDTIKGLVGDKTIIMVAHRLSYVKNSKKIYVLGGGQLVSSGSYESLFSDCNKFRDLVNAQHQ